MSVAILKISAEVLRQLLHLPSDCEVFSMESGHTVWVLVNHPSIPDKALFVNAIMVTENGVTRFDRFEEIPNWPAGSLKV